MEAVLLRESSADGKKFLPGETGCVIRYEGTSLLTAAQFQKKLCMADVRELLKAEVHRH